MNSQAKDGKETAPEHAGPAGLIHNIPVSEYGKYFRGKFRFFRRSCFVLLKLSAFACALYALFLWSLGSEIQPRGNHNILSPVRYSFLEFLKKPTGEEMRIARHFETDTLPGLMQRGLIRRYERRDAGTLLHVEGKIWKKRSRFFQESLLTEVLVYNKVMRFSPVTLVVDSSSQRLYARAISQDQKEFFD